MNTHKYKDFPVPPLKGRQSVRDAINEFFATFGFDNPHEVCERVANKLIDIAVNEVLERMAQKSEKKP